MCSEGEEGRGPGEEGGLEVRGLGKEEGNGHQVERWVRWPADEDGWPLWWRAADGRRDGGRLGREQEGSVTAAKGS